MNSERRFALVLCALVLLALPVEAHAQFRYYGMLAGLEERPDASLLTFDPASGNSSIGNVPVGPYRRQPGALQLSPDGLRAFIAGATDIAVVSLASGAVTRWPASPQPESLALSPDGTRLFVSDGTATGLVVLDTASGALVATLPLSHRANSIEVSADGAWLVAAGRTSGGEAALSIVELATTQITTHATPATDVDIAPDGSRVYVVDAARLSVYTRVGWTLEHSFVPDTNWAPRGYMDLSPDGRTLAVGFGVILNQPSDLYFYDTETRVATVVHQNGTGPLEWSADGAYLLAVLSNDAFNPSSVQYRVHTYEVATMTWTARGLAGFMAFGPWAIGPAPVCNVTVSPLAAMHREGGGVSSVTVQAPTGCPWTVLPRAGWLTAAPMSGSGNGTVTITAAPGTARTGVVTIGGRDVTVKQVWAQGNLDAPAGEAFQPALLSGWAFDADGTADSGVDAVHVWAYPRVGGAPVFLGVAPQFTRTDIRDIYGVSNAGFSLRVEGLTPGVYDIVAYAHSRHDGSFIGYGKTVTLKGEPPPDMAVTIDSFAPDRTLPQPLVVSGWALDRNAPSGTGIDTIHVWAFPVSGGAPSFVGVAAIGIPRTDVRNVFGHQFSHTGFSALADGLPAGAYDIVAYAHSPRTQRFEGQHVVRVTLAGTAEPGAVWQRSQEGLIYQPPLFSLQGYALDRRAPTGCGIDWVHVWAYPASGAPTFLGHVTPCVDSSTNREELVPLFGAEKANSGWQMLGLSLPPGTYTIVAYGRSTVTGQFDNVRTTTVVVGES